jgi:hypothetical protein
MVSTPRYIYCDILWRRTKRMNKKNKTFCYLFFFLLLSLAPQFNVEKKKNFSYWNDDDDDGPA